MKVLKLRKATTAEIIVQSNRNLLNKMIPSRDLPIYANSLTDPKDPNFDLPWQKKS